MAKAKTRKTVKARKAARTRKAVKARKLVRARKAVKARATARANRAVFRQPLTALQSGLNSFIGYFK